jgi:hypothetical protein
VGEDGGGGGEGSEGGGGDVLVALTKIFLFSMQVLTYRIANLFIKI